MHKTINESIQYMTYSNLFSSRLFSKITRLINLSFFLISGLDSINYVQSSLQSNPLWVTQYTILKQFFSSIFVTSIETKLSFFSGCSMGKMEGRRIRNIFNSFYSVKVSHYVALQKRFNLIVALVQSNHWPHLKNLSGGLNLSRGLTLYLLGGGC